MKRPLFDLGRRRLLGFGEAQKRQLTAAVQSADAETTVHHSEPRSSAREDRPRQPDLDGQAVAPRFS